MRELTREQRLIYDAKLKLDKTYERARSMMDNHRNNLRALQKSCPHDGPHSYVPDPSGNHDSYNKCHICGGEF